MEVYFKNLTSDGVSIEKLVEDLSMLANDVEHLVRASGGAFGDRTRDELMTVLERMKVRCESLKQQAVAGALATDRAIRRHPYPSLGLAFSAGVVLAVLACRRAARG